VLALLLEEQGSDIVEALAENAVLSAVNWAEVWQVSCTVGARVEELRFRTQEYGITIVPFDSDDAEQAGDLHSVTRERGLSLADRACLALAARQGVPAVTADRAWATLELDIEIICIR
jgi:PIN domain nuclease of toxin-antitoxin system